MMKTSQLSFFIVASLTAVTLRAGLVDVRELVASKKITEAAQLLKKDQQRLLKDLESQKQVAKWFSIFLYESSMEVYNQAEELVDVDPSAATDKFKELMTREPHNKIAMSAFISFLLNQKKWSEAQELIDQGRKDTPFFYIYNIYAAQSELLQERPAQKLNCELLYLEPTEKDLCYLTVLQTKALEVGPKRKPNEVELKKIAGKIKIPEAQYWLWKATSKETYLRSYESLCKNLSIKDKKNYRNVPSLCAKMPEVKTLLEPKKNDDPNSP